jgi:Txe/YoeB family toxin of Txe-Axe toxin-antitoxin module
MQTPPMGEGQTEALKTASSYWSRGNYRQASVEVYKVDHIHITQARFHY